MGYQYDSYEKMDALYKRGNKLYEQGNMTYTMQRRVMDLKSNSQKIQETLYKLSELEEVYKRLVSSDRVSGTVRLQIKRNISLRGKQIKKADKLVDEVEAFIDVEYVTRILQHSSKVLDEAKRNWR